MNIALRNKTGEVYYIASIRRNNDVFNAFGNRYDQAGNITARGQQFPFSNQKEAEAKVKDLVKTKMKRKDLFPTSLELLPRPVMHHLVVPPEMQATPEEMVMILKKAQVERYVVFHDVSGMEEYFDEGVEYIGYILEDDEYIIKVYDRYGTLRDCFRQRMSEIKPTERALEASSEKMSYIANTLELQVQPNNSVNASAMSKYLIRKTQLDLAQSQEFKSLVNAILMAHKESRQDNTQYLANFAVRFVAERLQEALPMDKRNNQASGYVLIPSWNLLNLKCAKCGTGLSVKYRLSDGRTVCNRCVIKT